MTKAAKLPSPVEELEAQTKSDEVELTKLREDALNAPDEPEELEEESLPSDDAEESEPEEEPVQPSKEEETEVVEEQEPELSQRGQERFRKLAEERKQALEELEKLKSEKNDLLSMVESLQSQGYTRNQAEQAVQDGINQGKIDPKQYQLDVERNAQAIVKQTLAEKEQEQVVGRAIERYTEDLQTIEEKHPELNEDNPEYDEDLSHFVAELYQGRFAKDPKTRLPDVVNQVMKLRGKAAEEAQKKQVSKVAKQASQQAMTSSGGKTETTNLATKLAEVDSEAELAELRKLLPTA